MIRSWLTKSKYGKTIVGLPFKDINHVKHYINKKNWKEYGIIDIYLYSVHEVRIFLDNGSIIDIDLLDRY